MSGQLDIVNAGAYLRVTFSGLFTIPAAKAAVDAMVDACRREGLAKVLFDCRTMTGELSVTDRFEMGQYGASTIPRKVRIAMLTREDVPLPDRFFEVVSRNRGLLLTVFFEPEAALEWLNAPETAP